MEQKGRRSRTTSDRRGNTGVLRPKNIDGTGSRISAEDQAGRQKVEGQEPVRSRGQEFYRQPAGRQDEKSFGRQRRSNQPFGRQRQDEQSVGKQLSLIHI